jgi:putative RNA 2'-phosphotransferase
MPDDLTRTSKFLSYVLRHRPDEMATNNKARFAVSDDGLRIRASQGHSIDVDLAYEPAAPPDLLYHGTATRFLESIREKGLVRGARHHVHLSADAETARAVGARHGKPLVLAIRSGDMAREGVRFYVSANGVWLTDAVPYEYIDEPDRSR